MALRRRGKRAEPEPVDIVVDGWSDEEIAAGPGFVADMVVEARQIDSDYSLDTGKANVAYGQAAALVADPTCPDNVKRAALFAFWQEVTRGDGIDWSNPS